MPEEPKKEIVALVVGDLLFNENAEMVRRLGEGERVTVLEEEAADALLSGGKIPDAWRRFGDLHYALVTDPLNSLSICKALTFGSEQWQKADRQSGALPPARLARLAFLCTAKP